MATALFVCRLCVYLASSGPKDLECLTFQRLLFSDRLKRSSGIRWNISGKSFRKVASTVLSRSSRLTAGIRRLRSILRYVNLDLEYPMMTKLI